VKRILIALGVILIIALFVFLNLKKSGKAFTVKVETVKKQKVVRIVRADGEVRARNQVEVGSDVMGRIVRILVSEGDVVERGDTLCLIDPSIYEAKVNQLEARLMSDKARLSKVEKDYIRAKKLWRRGLISESAFEEIKANYNTTLAQMRADSFALEEAREDLSKTVITSPVSGEVMRVYKEEGEMTVVGTINTPRFGHNGGGRPLGDAGGSPCRRVRDSIGEAGAEGQGKGGCPPRSRVHGQGAENSGDTTISARTGGSELSSGCRDREPR